MPTSDLAAPGATVQITTFDFHNTVAYCDPWFQLEIRELPAAVLDELAGPRVAGVSADVRAEATERYRALRRTIMEHGIEVDAQASLEQVFGEMGIGFPPEQIADAIERLMRATLDDLEPVPGAVEAITRLVDRGVPVGIISSAVYHPFLEWALTRFEVADRLSFVATSASVGYYKSDVRIYRHAYEAANATLSLGVHIGDSPRWDIDTAKQAGLAAVLFADPSGRAALHDHGELAAPDLVLPSMVGAEDALEPLLAARREEQAR